MISAKIIKDSISELNYRITTFELVYPRFIHSELATHRIFSKNSSSSRAVPCERMLKNILANPAMPSYWGKNQKGMQANEELGENSIREAMGIWDAALQDAVDHAKKLIDLGVHKQIANRILEPFAHMTTIVTATEWDNFYELRCHKDAQPEFQILAKLMKEAQENSIPKLLSYGEWHLPYIKDDEFVENSDMAIVKETAIKCSAARCCRVSYLNHDGTKPSVSQDLELYDRLVGSKPLHASPLEHQSTPDRFLRSEWKNPELHGNFKGWIQYRKLVEQNKE